MTDLAGLGFVSQFLSANPVVAFMAGSVMIALLLRYFGSVFRNDTRSESIDKASDALVKHLGEQVAKLTSRCDDLERDRDKAFRERMEIDALIRRMQDKVTSLTEENQRCRTENERLRVESDGLRRDIASLQAKVQALEAMRPGRSTDKA